MSSASSIDMYTGSTINGRLFSQTAVGRRRGTRVGLALTFFTCRYAFRSQQSLSPNVGLLVLSNSTES